MLLYLFLSCDISELLFCLIMNTLYVNCYLWCSYGILPCMYHVHVFIILYMTSKFEKVTDCKFFLNYAVSLECLLTLKIFVSHMLL